MDFLENLQYGQHISIWEPARCILGAGASFLLKHMGPDFSFKSILSGCDGWLLDCLEDLQYYFFEPTRCILELGSVFYSDVPNKLAVTK